MECVRGYIGIKSCVSTVIPGSGLYINSLPGISLEITEKIADSEQRNFLGAWKDIEERVVQKFSSEFQAGMVNKYSLVDCEECSLENLVCDNLDKFKLPLWYLYGVEWCAERIHSNRINRYTSIDLKKAKSLRAEFEVEFQRALGLAIDSLDCSECLECDNNYQLDESVM